jgi:hypothetical protein
VLPNVSSPFRKTKSELISSKMTNFDFSGSTNNSLGNNIDLLPFSDIANGSNNLRIDPSFDTFPFGSIEDTPFRSTSTTFSTEINQTFDACGLHFACNKHGNTWPMEHSDPIVSIHHRVYSGTLPLCTVAEQ